MKTKACKPANKPTKEKKLTKLQYFRLLKKTSKEGGFPAVNKDGECLYRGPKGIKCAVGLILPDSIYRDRI